ncbi:hypothetical protein F5Y12DRAFT_710421 [Xylaria sp. FL1777]|nr:hypothetical protein F5Y12DRAFT_710421 [Xylaria sp. FL1777]
MTLAMVKILLPPKAHFTTLHDRFNTASSALQEPAAFLHDVYDIAKQPDTIEFYSSLKQPKDQRARQRSFAKAEEIV